MHRNLQLACGIFVLCAAQTALAQDARYYSEEQVEQAALLGQMNICWNQPIPTTHVVVAHLTTSACNGTNFPGQPNTRTVKEPNPAGTIACEFPFPTGYVITNDKQQTSACKPSGGTNPWNAINVKFASQQENVCTNSPVPPGYTHGPSFASSQCRTGFAWTITN